MRTKSPIPPEAPDPSSEFRTAVGGVRPLRQPQSAVPPVRKGRPLPPRRAPLAASSLPAVLPVIDATATVRLARPGVQARALRRLDGDRFIAEAELDLHGLTAAQAAPALHAFVTECLAAGYEQVRVIHGKGGRMDHGPPVLKALVIESLKRHPSVLALRSAGRRDGASGALRVLLRGT